MCCILCVYSSEVCLLWLVQSAHYICAELYDIDGCVLLLSASLSVAVLEQQAFLLNKDCQQFRQVWSHFIEKTYWVR